MIGKILCLIGFHKLSNGRFVMHPHRYEMTCSRCGKKEVFL